MPYRFLYTPVAMQDYKESLSWYKERSLKAAENFVKSINIAIESICNDPYRYKNRYKNYRETLINKFPFYIIYFIDEENKTIIITAVYHSKRNPLKKYIR